MAATSQPGQGARSPRSILMVAPTSFFSDYGGHIRILEETLALQELGQQVHIVTYYKGGDVPGLNIWRTRRLPYHAEYEVGSSRHKVAFDAYLAATALRVGLKKRPDIIHGHMHEGALIGGMVAKALRVPLVFDFQGGLSAEMIDHGFLNPQGRIYPWVRRVERFICHLPDAILTSSTRARKLLTAQFGVGADRIHPLPDCVDTRRFDPVSIPRSETEALREQLGIKPGKPVFVYLGLLADYQGTDHLIAAAARLKSTGVDCHFLIMGYPREGYYRQMAQQAGVSDRVTLTGKVAYDEAARYLAIGDVALSAKMSATEGSGKVLNYMAMALPVVAYDTPVHREYLGPLGLYAAPGDAVALADAIAGSLKYSPARNGELGAALRERVRKHFSWEAAGTRICDVYDELILDRSIRV